MPRRIKERERSEAIEGGALLPVSRLSCPVVERFPHGHITALFRVAVLSGARKVIYAALSIDPDVVAGW